MSRLNEALAGRYRVERELGQGGMATVYLGHDLKHDRDVAIKVLHPDLGAALGSERFLSEIRTTARLQHPHILPLLDSGQADGLLYYVMPLVTGETLRARLERERQLPIADAVRIAREVADALGHAHGLSVIHRDIKPENILLQGGHAVVADFGIALAVHQAAGQRMTQTGLSLGTPQYMSPEQAMGERSVGPGSDIYALGAVTYEMLVGDPPFTGSSVQAVVAKVLTDRPAPISTVRDTVPAALEAAVLRALAKLPADRFASAREFAEALDGTVAMAPAAPAPGSAPRSPRAPGTRWQRAGAVAGGVALAGLAAWGWLRPVPSQPVTRQRLVVDVGLSSSSEVSAAISRDGGQLLMTGVGFGLALTRRDQFEPTVIPGMEDAWTPAFSPDGRHVVLGTGYPGALRILPLAGGSPIDVVRDSVHAYGFAWSPGGWIYYSAETTAGGLELRRVRADGSQVEILATPDTSRDELFFMSPTVDEGDAVVLFTVWRRAGPTEIATLDLKTRRMEVLTGGARAILADRGRLLAVLYADGALTAGRFDVRRRRYRGEPVVVERGVSPGDGLNVPPIAISGDGTLVYLPISRAAQVAGVSRSGAGTALGQDWLAGRDGGLRYSPDGNRVAYSAAGEGRLELWVRDLRTGTDTRLASQGQYSYRPAWTPDGRSVLFVSNAAGRSAVFQVPADGSGPPTLLLQTDRAVDEIEVSADGQWLIFRQGSGGSREIFARRVTGDTSTIDLLDTGAEEFAPTLSPDGRWLAYGSFENGADEVYVRPFANPRSGRWQISVGGGIEPRWSPSGRELFYRDGNGDIIAVAVEPGPAFQAGRRVTIRLDGTYVSDQRHASYDVSPVDGTFLMRRTPTGGIRPLHLVTNWFAAVEGQLRQASQRPR
ncbi:MAG TPA: protein kinase [Gemmatimonadales bacterium]